MAAPRRRGPPWRVGGKNRASVSGPQQTQGEYVTLDLTQGGLAAEAQRIMPLIITGALHLGGAAFGRRVCALIMCPLRVRCCAARAHPAR